MSPRALKAFVIAMRGLGATRVQVEGVAVEFAAAPAVVAPVQQELPLGRSLSAERSEDSDNDELRMLLMSSGEAGYA